MSSARSALSLSVLALLSAAATAGPAAAQSMNVRVIVQTVTAEVCAPFARRADVAAAIQNAERLGYRVIESGGDRRRAVTLFRQHHGTIRVSLSDGQGLCSIGVEEGTVAQVAAAAEPGLKALNLVPAIDDREGRPALSVWRGAALQAVIGPSPHHRPGVELILSVDHPTN